MGYVALVVLGIVVVVYAVLEKRWLAIPLCAVTGLVVALLFGAGFSINFVTEAGLPNLNPVHWWGSESQGWMLGQPTLQHFIASLPFAILAVAMWPSDFLGHRIFQQINYPKGSEKC